MEKKEVEIGNPVTVAGITLIPVARVSLHCWQSSHHFSFFGIKQPIAVAVVSPGASKAFRITGEEISLAQLIQEVPEIKERLAAV